MTYLKHNEKFIVPNHSVNIDVHLDPECIFLFI